MVALALTFVAASVKKAGVVKTARSPVALTTAPARVYVWRGSACATATLVATTVRSRAAPRTARAVACASTGSAPARRLSAERTAHSSGVSTTAQTRACATTGHASADQATWARTVHWSTVPTTAARRVSAKTGSACARTATLGTTATLVGLYLLAFSVFVGFMSARQDSLLPCPCLSKSLVSLAGGDTVMELGRGHKQPDGDLSEEALEPILVVFV